MGKYKELVELYTDYLIVVNGQATATDLSAVLDEEISHDKFTRMLASGQFDVMHPSKVEHILAHFKVEVIKQPPDNNFDSTLTPNQAFSSTQPSKNGHKRKVNLFFFSKCSGM